MKTKEPVVLLVQKLFGNEVGRYFKDKTYTKTKMKIRYLIYVDNGMPNKEHCEGKTARRVKSMLTRNKIPYKHVMALPYEIAIYHEFPIKVVEL